MEVKVLNGEITEEEKQAYIDYVNDKYDNVHELIIKLDGDYVDLEIHEYKPFERIRRITGYLVGSLSHFNNAKRAEVAARVKHGLGDNDESKWRY